MNIDKTKFPAKRRRIFVVLSPRSLGYAKYALQSLLLNALDAMQLYLITDSQADKEILLQEMTSHQRTEEHRWSVFQQEDLKDREARLFAGYPNLRAFRRGHPCWRKLTDPVLLSGPGEEMIVLDPDLYFPNRFSFEPTPERGLLLMWQKPNCLLPPEVVNTAFAANIALARHVDIGVAQWRGPVDLDWLEWLVGKLGGASLPRVMHVEAIVWAALAQRIGGGHLDPDLWLCWRRSQTKRVLLKAGVPGHRLLRSEPWSGIKCFHAGGRAKYWLAEARERGQMERGQMKGNRLLDRPAPVRPFVELTSRRYLREQTMRKWLRKTGYYRVFPSG